MRTDNIQKQIDYCEYVAKNAEQEDLRKTFTSIASNLRWLKRIVKNTYFCLNDNEQAAADKFYEEHVKGRYFGATGGGVMYQIIPHGLGQCVRISTKNRNGNIVSEDITDTDSW